MNSGTPWVWTVLIALLVPTFVGCAGTEPALPPTRPDAIRGELDKLLETGQEPVLITRLGALRRDGTLGDDELDRYRERTIARMLAAYEDAAGDDATDGEASAELLRLHHNLRVLDALPEEAAQPWQLRVSYAEMLASEGFDAGAVSELMRVSPLSAVPEATLREFSATARRLHDRRSVRAIEEALGANGAEPADGTEVDPLEPRLPDALVDATVTVWVNRGIRLESGVGIPDRSIGSGFFIDPDGYIITNYHVIASEVDPEYEGYSRLYVRMSARPEERVPARVVGWDRVFDIALLKVEVDAPNVISFTNIRTLQPGTAVFAIGSPIGLESSISSGIISAVGRRFLQMGDTLQVDVPVNPGNSGGPLLDSDGELVGVVFAGLSQFQGLNFAIPSFWVQHFLSELWHGGEVIEPWLGVAVHESSEGLRVLYVARDSPAYDAGLRVNDVLTSIDGVSTVEIGEAQNVILDYRPEMLVRVAWTRETVSEQAVIALGERPYLPVEEALQRDVEERLFPALYGMRLRSTGGVLERNYVVEEVLPGSIADESGISQDDPVVVRGFELDEAVGVALLQIVVKKRTEGFWRSGMQLPAYVDTDNFL